MTGQAGEGVDAVQGSDPYSLFGWRQGDKGWLALFPDHKDNAISADMLV